jgi:hypothetical protein
VLFCRVSEEGALGAGKWEAGTFVRRPSKEDLVVSPSKGAFLELTLPPSNVCFAEHFFRKAAAIMTEMCWATDITVRAHGLPPTA